MCQKDRLPFNFDKSTSAFVLRPSYGCAIFKHKHPHISSIHIILHSSIIPGISRTKIRQQCVKNMKNLTHSPGDLCSSFPSCPSTRPCCCQPGYPPAGMLWSSGAAVLPLDVFTSMGGWNFQFALQKPKIKTRESGGLLNDSSFEINWYNYWRGLKTQHLKINWI